MIRFLKDLKFGIRFDVKYIRTRFFVFLFRLVPNLYIFKILKNLFLKAAGVKIGWLDNYILHPCYIDYASNIRIGKGTFVNIGVHMEGNAPIVIGNNCQVGPFCMMETTNHRGNKTEHLPIHIGNNVWLGAGVIVLPGTRIGDNITIAAGAVVRGEVKKGSLWGGIPARKIR